MSRPQVINVPPSAGVGSVPAVQIPTSSSVITLLNLSSSLGLTLCTDPNFEPTTTWPLPPNVSIPHTDMNNLWAQNNNSDTVQVLVIQGIIPITYVPTTGAQNLAIKGSTNVVVTPLSSTSWNLQPMADSYQTLTMVLNVTAVGTGNSWTLTSGSTTLGTGPVLPLGNNTQTITFDGSIYNSVTLDQDSGNTFTVVSASSGATNVSIAPAPPGTTSQNITYTITQPSTGTANIVDTAGNTLGSIDLNQPAGTYTIAVPVVTTGTSSLITNTNAYLKVLAAYTGGTASMGV